MPPSGSERSFRVPAPRCPVNGEGISHGQQPQNDHAVAEPVLVNHGPYTVSADGKKFVMNTVSPQSITEPLTLITNWPADLKR